RDLELPAHGSLVECFDILELMDEAQTFCFELVVSQGVEHERIVRIGAVPDPDRLDCPVTHRLGSWSRSRVCAHPTNLTPAGKNFVSDATIDRAHARALCRTSHHPNRKRATEVGRTNVSRDSPGQVLVGARQLSIQTSVERFSPRT